jgi:hypothetical protein
VEQKELTPAERKALKAAKKPRKPPEDKWADELTKADAEHEKNQDRWPMFDWE